MGGPPYFNARWGQPLGWKQQTLLYATDPGALSSYVSHAQADALVAAAAGVWNVPVASITVAQGAPLAEDVSGQNVYVGSAGVVFPADVMSTNAAQVPLAVIYDQDGAVTDTLLGAGASSPSACRQNAVTESVDGFDPAGYIAHALVIVNGRCTGPAAAQQLQLQYQLERIFGRVLGLAWSQANDNVYTGTPAPTAQQQAHWPIMHPLDIVCGLYTYQCLPQPFTLRPDDIASLVGIYPNAAGTALPPGKTVSLANAAAMTGWLDFPTGEGMGGTNVLVRLAPPSSGVLEPWVTASAVTGAQWRRADGSPFVPPLTTPAASFGGIDPGYMGYMSLPYLPALDSYGIDSGADEVVFTTEPVNPLYTGSYSLSANPLGTVAPSGSALAQTRLYGFGAVWGEVFTAADAAANCGTGADGTFYAPMQTPAGGWWNGQLCGYGHASYVQAAVRPGRTFTVEVTALDQNGLATTAKARPVLGIYAPGDAPYPYGYPSVAVAPQAFQALTVGTTTLTAATGQQTSLTLGIADQRGNGRPDMAYQARLFYADTVSPAMAPAAGAKAVISGLGFRPGNVVTVNGVGAQVLAWTQTTITLTLPAMAVAHASSGVAVDVTVADLGTGATSTMTGALTYLSTQPPPPAMRVLQAPASPVYTGLVQGTPFQIQELAADGVTPVVGEPVTFSIGAAGAGAAGSLSACGGAACTVTTDAAGQAAVNVTVAQAGPFTLSAVDARDTAVAVTVGVQAIASAGSMTLVSAPTGTFYNTQAAAGTFGVQVWTAAAPGSPAAPLAGRPVQFTVTAGGGALRHLRRAGLCGADGPERPGPGHGDAGERGRGHDPGGRRRSDPEREPGGADWADTLTIVSAPASGYVAGQWAGNFTVRLVHGDGVTPDSGKTIALSGTAA